MVEPTPLKKYDRQNGNLHQLGVNIKNIWNHHPEISHFQIFPAKLWTDLGYSISIWPNLRPKWVASPHDCHDCIAKNSVTLHGQRISQSAQEAPWLQNRSGSNLWFMLVKWHSIQSTLVNDWSENSWLMSHEKQQKSNSKHWFRKNKSCLFPGDFKFRSTWSSLSSSPSYNQVPLPNSEATHHLDGPPWFEYLSSAVCLFAGRCFWVCCVTSMYAKTT